MPSRQIVIEVPEKILLAEKTDEVAFAKEMRLLTAIKLYELGRLSSGRAAELAGMPRVEFLLTLGRYKVFPFEDELRDLEKQDGIGRIVNVGSILLITPFQLATALATRCYMNGRYTAWPMLRYILSWRSSA